MIPEIPGEEEEEDLVDPSVEQTKESQAEDMGKAKPPEETNAAKNEKRSVYVKMEGIKNHL